MNKTRTIIKKIVFKTLGEGVYAKAYARGKIKDINQGVLDEKEAQFLTQFIHSDSTVLDIGANYGHYAIDMSRICTEGKVYAFEPIPFTFRVLEAVKKHFNANHIILQHAAVSDSAGTVEMTLPLLDFGAPNTGVAYVGSTAEKRHKRVNVPTIRLDDQMIDGRVDFIKIDIEGHEPEAFRGMEELIGKNRPVVLIEFSHNCLNRAKTDPAIFATYLTNELNYIFAAVSNETLKIVTQDLPNDGYYFLIPREKRNDFNLDAAL